MEGEPPTPVVEQLHPNFSQLARFQIDSFYGEIQNLSGITSDRRSTLLNLLSSFKKKFLKLLVLYRIPNASSISFVNAMLDTQDQQIEQCANELFVIHKDLLTSQLPVLDLVSGIDVLGSGRYQKLPLVVKKRFATAQAPDKDERLAALEDLEMKIRLRLLCHEVLPKPFQCNQRIEAGCVHFTVPGEFSISLTLYLGATKHTWKIMSLDFHFSSAAPVATSTGAPSAASEWWVKDTAARKEGFIHQAQTRLSEEGLHNFVATEPTSPAAAKAESNHLLMELYYLLHVVCLRYKVQIIAIKATTLKETWGIATTRVLQAVGTGGTTDTGKLAIKFWIRMDEEGREQGYTLEVEAAGLESGSRMMKATTEICEMGNVAYFVNQVGKKKEGDLLVKVLGLKEDEQVLGLDGLRADDLDLEGLLSNVTDRLVDHITNFWHTSLSTKPGFSSTILKSKIGAITITALQVVLNQLYTVNLSINGRTGRVYIELLGTVDDVSHGDPDKVSFITTVIKLLEDQLHVNYYSVGDVLDNLSLALHLQSVEVTALQLGFRTSRIAHPGTQTSNASETLADSLNFHIGADNLGSCSILVETEGGSSRCAFKVSLVQGENGGSIPICPADIQQALRFGKEESSWAHLSSTNLLDIHRHALYDDVFSAKLTSRQYLSFTRMCAVIDNLSASYQFVLPHTLDPSKVSKSFVISTNPFLSVRIFATDLPVRKSVDNLKYAMKIFPIAVFLRMVIDQQSAGISTLDLGGERAYESRIRVPGELAGYISAGLSSNTRGLFDPHNCSIFYIYQSFEDYSLNFLSDAVATLSTIMLGLSLGRALNQVAQPGIQWMFTDSNALLVSLSSTCQMNLKIVRDDQSLKRIKILLTGSVAGQIVSSPSLNMLAPHVEELIKSGESWMHVIFEHLALVTTFMLEMEELASALNQRHESGIIIQIRNPFQFAVIFGTTKKAGLLIEVFRNHLSIQDACHVGGPMVPLPFFQNTMEGKTEIKGLMTSIRLSSPTSVQLQDRILIPSADVNQTVILLETYIERFLGFCNLSQFLESMPPDDADVFDFKNYQIIKAVRGSKLLFAHFGLDTRICRLQIGKKTNKEFQEITAFLFKMIDGIPPREINSLEWCKMMIPFATISDESVLKDLYKLVTTVLAPSAEPRLSTASLLLRVPLEPALIEPGYPSPSSPSFDINATSIKFLFQFKDETNCVLLPFTYTFQAGGPSGRPRGVDWWTVNPYGPGTFKSIERFLSKSRELKSKFPGISDMINSFQKRPVASLLNQ